MASQTTVPSPVLVLRLPQTTGKDALQQARFPPQGSLANRPQLDMPSGPGRVPQGTAGHGFAVVAGCIHGNTCPWGPSWGPCSPRSQRLERWGRTALLGLCLLLPSYKTRRPVFGGPTPHSHGPSSSSACFLCKHNCGQHAVLDKKHFI